MLGIKKHNLQVLVGVLKVLVEAEEVVKVGLAGGNVDRLVDLCNNFIRWGSLIHGVRSRREVGVHRAHHREVDLGH